MPKRSAGCFECRKRKVRCDETKPECNTCLRRGTKCPGYRPTQSFILHTFDEGTERPGLIKEDENRYKFANLNPQAPETTVVQLRSSQEREVDAPLPKQISPAAIERVQFLGTFLSLYLPTREGEVLTPPSALILHLPQLPASRQVMLAALDALSLAQLAVDNKNYPLINRTRSLYGTALSQLLTAITEPESSKEDETLLATYLLGLYEVFVGVTGGHGFFYHVQGLLHLLKLRGPASIKSRLSIDIFHGVRYNSMTIGYRLRRASMLDAPEWLEVTSKASKVDPYVSLIDICIHIPRLLERTDRLTRTQASSEEFETLILDSQAHADRAFEWLVKYEENGKSYSRVPPEQLHGSLQILDEITYDPVFMFHSFAAYTTLINFWMAMLILRSNTFMLVRKYRRLEPKQLMLWDRELTGYADSICRGVHYGCRPAAGYSGRFGTLTPLIVAKKYLEAKGAVKEAAWCDKVFHGTRVPGLYAPPIDMEVKPGIANYLQNSSRYIL